jgi:hypothetical protein
MRNAVLVISDLTWLDLRLDSFLYLSKFGKEDPFGGVGTYLILLLCLVQKADGRSKTFI